MSDTPAIRLKRGEGRAFKAGGPWIYDNEIAEILGEPADGGIVRIEDYNGYPLGVGFLNRASTIAVRVLSRDAGAVIDRDFLERRVRAAWQYRKDTVDTSSCRVIFGEADFLPGLVVDKFADVLVVESLALGIDRLKSTILSLLVDLLKEDGISVRGIYERSDAKVRLKEGMERVKGFLSDPFDPVVEIVENGVRYQVDVAEGQKTGFFLDQKYNRLAIQPLARGGRVLDCFTHTGAFALNAAKGGAAEVLGVDASELGVAQATQNAALNGIGRDRYTVRAGDILSDRALAAQLAINPNTIQRAYMELEQQGLICPVKGKGSFVTDSGRIRQIGMEETLSELKKITEKGMALGVGEEEMIGVIRLCYKEGNND